MFSCLSYTVVQQKKFCLLVAPARPCFCDTYCIITQHSTTTKSESKYHDVIPKQQILPAYFLTTNLIVHHYPLIIFHDDLLNVIQTWKRTINLPCIIFHTGEFLPSDSVWPSYLSKAKFSSPICSFLPIGDLVLLWRPIGHV